jgi:hypothetical protein
MKPSDICFYYQGDTIKEGKYSYPASVDGVEPGRPNTHPFHITRGGRVLPFQTGSVDVFESGDSLGAHHHANIPQEWFLKVNMIEIIV